MTKYSDAADQLFSEDTAQEQPATPVSTSKYGAAADAVFGAQDTQLRSSVMGAAGKNPDQVAKAAALGRKTGVPALVAERNMQEVERTALVDDLDKLTADTPAVRRAYTDQYIASAASDDGFNLTKIERGLREFLTGSQRVKPFDSKAAYKNTAQRFDLMTNQDVADMKYGVVQAPEGVAPTIENIVKGIAQAIPQRFDAVREGSRMQMGDMFEALGILKRDPVQMVDAQRKLARAQGASKFTTPEFETTTGQGLYGGAVSTAQNLTSLVATVLTRNPAAGLSILGAETQADAYGKYRTRGGTPLESLGGSAAEAAIEVGTELLPMRVLSEKLGRAGVGDFLKSYLAKDLPTEQLATLLQDAVDTAVANPNKTWGEYLSERPGAAYQTLLGTLVQAGTMGAASVAVGKAQEQQAREYQETQQKAQALQEIMVTAAGSKLRERDPTTFREVVQAAAEEHDGAPKSVFVDGQVLMQTLQQAGVTDEQLDQLLPSVRAQLADAAGMNAPVEIPIGELVSAVPGSPLEQALVPHIRATADGLSPFEAEQAQEQAQEFLQSEATRVMQASADSAQFSAEAEAVRENIKQQLDAAGRFSSDVTGKYATLVRDFYTVMSSRTGMTPAQMYQALPYKINAQGQTGGVLNLDQRAPGTWFHGTGSDVQKFERIEGGNAWGPGYYLTDNPDTASGYATGTAGSRIAPEGNAGPNVMPVRVTDGALFDMVAPVTPTTLKKVEKALGEKLKDYTWPGMKNRDLRQILFTQFTDQAGANEVLKKAGYVGVVENNPALGAGRTLMVFDAKDISSDFDGKTLAQSAKGEDIGAKLMARVQNDFASTVKEYDALPESNGGQIINTDIARELSPEYREDRTRSAEVHDAASAMMTRLYTEKLAQPVPEGRDAVVLFTAGGTGAGKSTGLELMPELAGNANLIYDGTMSKLQGAVDKIEQALAAGRDVQYMYVYREPAEALQNGALPRAMRSGRTAPLQVLQDSHTGARAVAEALAEKYKDDPRVQFIFVDNSHGKDNAKVVALANIPPVPDNGLKEKLNEILDQEYQAGNISAAVYSGTKKPVSAAARSEGNDARGVQPEAGPAVRGQLEQGRNKYQVKYLAGRDVAALNTEERAQYDALVTPANSEGSLNQDGQAPKMMAVHNLSIDNLLYADKIGGLAVPSVGVITDQAGGVEGFGEITLIGRREMVDPKSERVFSSDAYTMRFPRPEYAKAKSKDAMKLVEKVRAVSKEFDDRSLVDVTFDSMVNTPKPDEVVSKWLRSNATKALYLREQGTEVAPVTAPVRLESGLTVAQYAELRPLFDQAMVAGVEGSPEEKELQAKIEAALRENYKALGKREVLVDKLVSHAVSQYEYVIGKDARAVAAGPQVDFGKTSEALDAALKGKEAEFKEWVEDQIVPKFGEPFLKVGSKKLPYTLLNIVDAMTDSKVKGKEKTMTYGPGQVRAAASVEFSNLEQMREAAKKSIADPEAYGVAKEQSEKLLSDYREAVVQYTTIKNWRGEPDVWEAMDGSMRALAKWATSKKQDATTMKAALKAEDFNTSVIPAELIKQAITAGRALLDAPVPYFEAKPQRAVGLGEFAGAVVPTNTPKEVLDVLARNGIATKQLAADEDRTQAAKDFAAELSAKGEQTLFQDMSQGPRGTFSPSTLTTVLNESADLSTFLHETGHFFLEAMAYLAAQPTAAQSVRDDMNALLKWFGVEDLETWRAMTLEQQRKYHERFAESFEQYLLEGRAPSVELASLFRTFRAWLTRVYRSLSEFMDGRDLQFSDDIRQVMDRMLATEEQIAEAEKVAGLVPELDATGEAIENLQARSIRDLKWAVNARNKVIKQLQAEAKEKRKVMTAEVTAEVNEMPPVKAKAALDAIRKETRAAPSDMAMGVVADANGYADTAAMLEAIDMFGRKADVIEGMTDQRMLERYGDLTDQASIEQAATEAVHNTARAKSLATELAAQRELLNPRADTGKQNAKGQKVTVNALVEAAKQFAANVIGRRKLADLKKAAWGHLQAERRASKAWEEATAKGDTKAAVQAKQDQMLNHYAVKAANDAQDQVKKSMELFAKVTKGNNEKLVERGYDPDVANAARAILAMYGVGVRGEKGAMEYLSVLEKNDPAMFSAVRGSIEAAVDQAKPLDQLTVSELEALTDEIKSLWHLARRSRQAEIDGNLIDRTELEEKMKDRLEAIGIPDTMPGDMMAITPMEQAVRLLSTFRAAARRVESWVGAMDGSEAGPFTRYAFQPVKEAADRYRTDKAKFIKRYRDLLDKIEFKRGTIVAPELGYVFGRDTGGIAMSELLHAILHTGNASNKRKLLLGRGWATENADGTLNTTRWDSFITRMVNDGVLTKDHFDFAQGVWDLLEETKPLAQKTHRDVFGRYFAEVTADAFDTPFGRYKGGYAPAMADSRIVSDAATRTLAEAENDSMAYAFPATSRGFTKGRVDYNRPLMLDLRTLAQHIDKVLLFSHLESPVRDVRKLLTAKGVAYGLNRIDPVAFDNILTPWLNRASRQQVETPVAGAQGLMRVFSAARSRAGMAAMFANVANSAQQLTGFAVAATKVKPTYLISAAAEMIANPKRMAQSVGDASVYMKERMENDVANAESAVRDILLDPNVYDKAKNWSAKHAYFLQQAIDNAMSPAIWTAAFNQSVAEGKSDKDAVRYADSVVRTTQGSTLPEDVSRIEGGNAFVRMFTQFGGYFNMLANLQATELGNIAREIGVKNGAGKMLYVVLMGYLAQAWVGEAIMQAFKGGPDDEDKDGEYLDDWLAAVFGWSTVRGMTAMVPVAGQITNAAVNATNSKPYDDRIGSSPAISMIESSVRAPVTVYKAIADEGNRQKAVRDVATMISMMTGIPVSAAAKPLGYLAGVSQGKIDPTGPVDAVRGAVSGVASPQSK